MVVSIIVVPAAIPTGEPSIMPRLIEPWRNCIKPLYPNAWPYSERVNAVIEMWECEWDRLVDIEPAVSQFLRSFDLVPPLEPREAFIGGRTGSVALHAVSGEGEEIRCVDVTSLYPWVNKNCPYPIGHPQIITQPVDQSLGSYFGIATVDILPHAGFHPVLPVRSGQKLTFPLCRTYVQEEQAKPMLSRNHYCPHSDADRTLRGTWCTPELVKAVENARGTPSSKSMKSGIFPSSNAGRVFLLITSTHG